MRVSQQLRTGVAANSYPWQRRYLGPARDGRQDRRGPRWKTRRNKVMMSLVMVGVVLLLWAQPVAAAVTITEFQVPSPGVPQGITAGPDGALWLTLLNDTGGSTTNQIGRLTTNGALTKFTVPKASYIWDITAGPDGNLYFTDGASAAWRVTTKGHFTRFPFKDSTGGYPYQITKGSDGNLWFTDRSHQIVKMNTSGQFTTFTLPASDGTTDDIAAGTDGNLWFTLDVTGKIGRITPAGKITEFSLANPNHDYVYLSGITAGPDGNLWFTYEDYNTHTSQIGRITTIGNITLTPTPTADSSPTDIAKGPDGALWFTEATQRIGRSTTS